MALYRTERLQLVPAEGERGNDVDGGNKDDATSSELKDLDWTILMARAQDGDPDAYLRLLGEITPYLRFLTSRRHRDPRDIEDSVQDILLTVHSIRQTYDPSRPFGPWLLAIANRRIFDRLRRQMRERLREPPLTGEHEGSSTQNVDSVLDSRRLEGAINRLPSTQRDAIRLLKIKELSLKEASSTSGISVGALKVATHRGLKALRKILEERGIS